MNNKDLYLNSPKGPKPETDVVLRDKGPGSNPKLEKKNKHRYSIIVPYPTYVRRFRLMNFATTPFSGTAASDLGVMPLQMAGINVFTYDGVDDGSVMFQNINTGDPPVSVGSTLDGLNIHLYSQPDDWGDLPTPGSKEHIEKFNELVEYHLILGGPKKLNLADKGHKPTYVEDGPTDILPVEFGSLYELPDYPPKVCSSKKDEIATSAQPVECLQGWGS